MTSSVTVTVIAREALRDCCEIERDAASEVQRDATNSGAPPVIGPARDVGGTHAVLLEIQLSPAPRLVVSLLRHERHSVHLVDVSIRVERAWTGPAMSSTCDLILPVRALHCDRDSMVTLPYTANGVNPRVTSISDLPFFLRAIAICGKATFLFRL